MPLGSLGFGIQYVSIKDIWTDRQTDGLTDG